MSARRFQCDHNGREAVLVGEVCRELAGRSLVSLSHSPSTNLLLAVSADGRHPKPVQGLFGSGAPTSDAYGQHYIQLISLAGSGLVSAPLKTTYESAR